jgi:hypothetical protein
VTAGKIVLNAGLSTQKALKSASRKVGKAIPVFAAGLPSSGLSDFKPLLPIPNPFHHFLLLVFGYGHLVLAHMQDIAFHCTNGLHIDQV